MNNKISFSVTPTFIIELNYYHQKRVGHPSRKLLASDWDIYTRLSGATMITFPVNDYYIPTANQKLRVDWDIAKVYVVGVGFVRASDPVGAWSMN